MNLRRAVAADALAISALVQSLSTPLLASADGAGAEPFFASIAPPAIESCLLAPNFSYWVAEDDASPVGVVALRDERHLFHLFVAEPQQRRGLGVRLWESVRDAALAAGNPGEFTVNSSRGAVGFYRKLGFVDAGALVRKSGVVFQPMRLTLPSRRALPEPALR